MKTTTKPTQDQIAELRRRYEAYNELRQQLNLPSPLGPVWWASDYNDARYEVFVEFDGVDKWVVKRWKDVNPVEGLLLEKHEFDDEDAAIAKARELVSWDEE